MRSVILAFDWVLFLAMMAMIVVSVAWALFSREPALHVGNELEDWDEKDIED